MGDYTLGQRSRSLLLISCANTGMAQGWGTNCPDSAPPQPCPRAVGGGNLVAEPPRCCCPRDGPSWRLSQCCVVRQTQPLPAPWDSMGTGPLSWGRAGRPWGAAAVGPLVKGLKAAGEHKGLGSGCRPPRRKPWDLVTKLVRWLRSLGCSCLEGGHISSSSRPLSAWERAQGSHAAACRAGPPARLPRDMWGQGRRGAKPPAQGSPPSDTALQKSNKWFILEGG